MQSFQCEENQRKKRHDICLSYLSGGPGMTLKVMVWDTMTFYRMEIFKRLEKEILTLGSILRTQIHICSQ